MLRTGSKIFCVFSSVTWAHGKPGKTFTIPPDGTRDVWSQFCGNISDTVCWPTGTLMNPVTPLPGFWAPGPTPSRRNVNWGTGVIGLFCVSKVRLVTSIHPVTTGVCIVVRSSAEISNSSTWARLSRTMPSGAFGLTSTSTWKMAVPPAARDWLLHVTTLLLFVPPAVALTNMTCNGRESRTVKLLAITGEEFVTAMAYVSRCPGTADVSWSVFDIRNVGGGTSTVVISVSHGPPTTHASLSNW